MLEHDLIFSIFIIFSGAALLSTAALMTRQSMLVAYMLLGILVGPWGFKLITNTKVVSAISDVGIIFLLFLLGLHLTPQKLIHAFKKISGVALISSVIFAAIGYSVAYIAGYSSMECAVISASLIFSSTVIGIKLLPTTVLHHQHTGEVMISVLLFQDLIAILVLLFLNGDFGQVNFWHDIIFMLIAFPAILIFAYFFTRFVLLFLFSKFNRIKEYMFLLAIGWCLGMAQLAVLCGLSAEVGAFVAGVSIASSPVSLYIAESLKPVRDFFLVMFFFSVGAGFDLNYVSVVIVPALILTVLIFIAKPVVYAFLLKWFGENSRVSWEVAVRLAQNSEFSLIIASVALANQLISSQVGYLIEAVTMLTFIVSSYWVVMKYPTPVALSDKLRRD